jgi:galactokinase
VGDWSDYVVGVLRELQALEIEPPPFELRVSGNVPLSAGLSSSASLEVATAIALLSHAGRDLPAEHLARLCQRAENSYVGSPCGIMDQFVSTSAVAGDALLLNTRDLSFELLPMNSGGLAECCIVVANSGVKHSIGGGEYGARRAQLEEGQAILRSRFPELRDLGDANMAQLAECERNMTAESIRRCRHVISENRRVQAAKQAMLAGDPVELGKIMVEAHLSERDDFECSVEEVDFLVEAAVKLSGCFGARLTGGGFGGCTVNLVRSSDAAVFAERLKGAYRQRFKLEAETFLCDAADGAMARNLQRAR